MTELLAVSDIHKSYGAVKVLKGVNLSVSQGETFAIIGPNGAGKTTLFKVMTGETPGDSGAIRFDGVDITREPAHARVRRGVGRTFQVARVYGEATAIENVIVAVEARQNAQGRRTCAWHEWRPDSAVLDEAHALLGDIGLREKGDVEARSLSHGDRKRLELALTLAGHPRILMLDEPTAGMSPGDRAAATDLIARVRDEKRVTIVMTEHDMGVIFGLANRIMVLNYGEIIACGSLEEVRANSTVQDIYLGREHSHA
ncbi:ABC transporter ATP-binding protein [Terrarubrum flagellatum]|uniref:ABC transporter ATP-binding protein n=1 Tax=Terrirubrum flagellatum TaxID=2895980 RepID=UPI0031454CDD